MKLLSSELENFGSYERLTFDFNKQGLTLIHGATGSGKSTLQDAAAWILFGVTAKDGNADEIRNWDNLDKVTTGFIDVELSPSVVITICRIRGKANQNDLYWVENHVEHRGKDILETQKLLEERLNVTKDLYLAGAYFNEFSSTGLFFIAKAKERRELFENLANLELPIKLVERSVNAKKEARKNLTEASANYNKAIGRVEQLRKFEITAEEDARRWDRNQEKTVKELGLKSKSFESDKVKKIEDLQKRLNEYKAAKAKSLALLGNKLEAIPHAECPECHQPSKEYHRLVAEIERLNEYDPPFLNELKVIDKLVNTYETRLEEEKARANPFTEQLKGLKDQLDHAEDIVNYSKTYITELNRKINGYGQIYDLSFKLRAELLRKTIKEVEADTNRYLESYFDAEIRVSFTLEHSDNLEITIFKDGHECVYKQLSKGQRGLLKLCFSIAVMEAAANKAGTHFYTLFFDEALDGLDSNLKEKAFGLFSELELRHSSVFVIEHSPELKGLFFNKIHVILEAGTSILFQE